MKTQKQDKRFACYFEYDSNSETVTITGAKHGNMLMKMKVPKGFDGTITRLEADYDCDNFWIGIKPSDDLVFNCGLFREGNSVHLQSIDYVLIDEKTNKIVG